MSDGTAWFDQLRIDKDCRLVAMCKGCITLTRSIAQPEQFTLWLYNRPLATNGAQIMRAMYADYLRGHWLERFYR